jgi:hypothetical protein
MTVGLIRLMDLNGNLLAALRRYQAVLEYNDIAYEYLDPANPHFWAAACNCRLIVFKWGLQDTHRQLALDLLAVLNLQLRIPCFPNWATSWHYDDKVKQYCLLSAADFPIVPTTVCWDRAAALQWVQAAEFPKVFKLRAGAGSKNVRLVRTRREAIRLVKRMFGPGMSCNDLFCSHVWRPSALVGTVRHQAARLYRLFHGRDPDPYWQRQKNYVLFQDFLPGNMFDTRVTVIGERAFAFRRHVRPRDFRASGSGLIDYDVSAIDSRCLTVAHGVSQAMGFQSMAYDFLYDPGGAPRFCEISYDYVSQAVYNCSGYWDRQLNWHDGHYLPEALHLADALGQPIEAPQSPFG